MRPARSIAIGCKSRRVTSEDARALDEQCREAVEPAHRRPGRISVLRVDTHDEPGDGVDHGRTKRIDLIDLTPTVGHGDETA